MSVYKSLPNTERVFISHPVAASAHHGRSSRRYLFFALFAFFFAGTLSYLATKHPTNSAATVVGFNPGNIMNDYTMGNYNSMTEAEIQAFLTAKNPCNNTSYSTYQYLIKHYNEDLGKPTSTHSWHFEDGHFVCLSEELFGEGTEIGVKDGETAAHIIWQAAQDYKINPQVLIVLLQKEQGLITDTIPRNGQYRSATGYGCPDTAACDAKYYGLKNQIRNAAALFRLGLDGKSSYYPIGNNFVLYHPNEKKCGGSWVYIENRATGILYRYTPYQPNSAALAAGTGNGDSCSAYGNRNFYHYFTEWFGSTQTEAWSSMVSPRVFTATSKVAWVDAKTAAATGATLEAGEHHYFSEKILLEMSNGQVVSCLGDAGDTTRCVPMSSLQELVLPQSTTTKVATANQYTCLIDLTTLKIDCSHHVSSGQTISYTGTISIGDNTYYITNYSAKQGYLKERFSETTAVAPTTPSSSSSTSPSQKYQALDFVSPRYMKFISTTSSKSLSGSDCPTKVSGSIQFFSHKVEVDGEFYYLTTEDIETGNWCVIPSDSVLTLITPIKNTSYTQDFLKFVSPRNMQVIYDTVAYDMDKQFASCKTLHAGDVLYFDSKIYIGLLAFYRASDWAGSTCVVPANALREYNK